MTTLMMNFKQQSESIIEITCIIFPNCTIMRIYWLIIIVSGHKTFGNESYVAFFEDIHNVATKIDPSICLTLGFANNGNINITNDMYTGTLSETTNTQTASIKRTYNDAIRTQGNTTGSAEACITNLLLIILVYYFDYIITIKFYFLQAKRRKTSKTNTRKKRKKKMIIKQILYAKQVWSVCVDAHERCLSRLGYGM